MSWRLADRSLDLAQPLAAGIVNVTVDSMFEGARSGTPEQAIADGLALVEAGFEMLDVGAVAAKSGPPVPAEVEAAALVPAIEGLVGAGVPISADTFSVRGGAGGACRRCRRRQRHLRRLGGDVRARRRGAVRLRADAHRGAAAGRPAGARVRRRGRVPGGVVRGGVERARGLGVTEEQIAIDPGLDFDLNTEQDLEILRRLPELLELGLPLYVSLSRKDFIGAVLAGSWEERLPAGEREWGTVAAVALAVRGGADVLRIHDRSSLQAMRVAGRVARPARSTA